MLLVRIGWWPRTVVSPAAEVFSFESLSFEFVEDFGFPVWLRPPAAGGTREKRLHRVPLRLVGELTPTARQTMSG